MCCGTITDADRGIRASNRSSRRPSAFYRRYRLAVLNAIGESNDIGRRHEAPRRRPRRGNGGADDRADEQSDAQPQETR